MSDLGAWRWVSTVDSVAYFAVADLTTPGNIGVYLHSLKFPTMGRPQVRTEGISFSQCS
jgi:hypothetical protein